MLHKVEDKRRLFNTVQEHLKNSPEVRPFPAAVARLAAACQDPNANGSKFESIIECDPSLSVKILRLANSPLFCATGDVKSISHAVALLGVRKLKSVAMTVAGAGMFSVGSSAEVQRQQLWSHSVGTASVARCLAEYVPSVSADDAFLAGVFHDVGKLMLYDALPEEYAEIDSSFHDLALVEEEKFLMGTTHETIGLGSVESWGLPNEIRVAVGWHHRPGDAPSCPEVAEVVHVANGLAKQWGIGSEPTPQSEQATSNEYCLTEEQLDGVRTNARNSFEETMSASN